MQYLKINVLIIYIDKYNTEGMQKEIHYYQILFSEYWNFMYLPFYDFAIRFHL